MRSNQMSLGILMVFLLLPSASVFAFDNGNISGMILSPVAEGVLAAMIFLSLLAEIKTAGFSGGSVLAAIAGSILIGAHWTQGNGSIIEFILFFGGMALILADMLILFTGAAAAGGVVFIIAGFYLVLGGGVQALYILSIALILSTAGIYFLADHLSRSRLWEKISLKTTLKGKEGYRSSSLNLKEYTGLKGMALTDLRPVGKIIVSGRIVDAVSDGLYINKGESVFVLKAESTCVVVCRAKESFLSDRSEN